MEKNGVSTNGNRSDGKSEQKMIDMSPGHDALSTLSMATLRMRRRFVLCDRCLKESVTGPGNTTTFSVDVLCSEMLVLQSKSRIWIDSKIGWCVLGMRAGLCSTRDEVGVRTALLKCSSKSLSLCTNLVSIS
jgi:hypothetical protein